MSDDASISTIDDDALQHDNNSPYKTNYEANPYLAWHIALLNPHVVAATLGSSRVVVTQANLNVTTKDKILIDAPNDKYY